MLLINKLFWICNESVPFNLIVEANDGVDEGTVGVDDETVVWVVGTKLLLFDQVNPGIPMESTVDTLTLTPRGIELFSFDAHRRGKNGFAVVTLTLSIVLVNRLLSSNHNIILKVRN